MVASRNSAGHNSLSEELVIHIKTISAKHADGPLGSVIEIPAMHAPDQVMIKRRPFFEHEGKRRDAYDFDRSQCVGRAVPVPHEAL